MCGGASWRGREEVGTPDGGHGSPPGRRWWCLGSGDSGRVAEKWMDFGDLWEVEITELADE